MAKNTAASKAQSEAKPATTDKPTPGGVRPTVSDFIRAQPMTMKAAEVVEAGKKAGLNISPNLIYMVRSRLNARAGAPVGRRGRPQKTATTPGNATTRTSARGPASTDEHELARLILTIGFDRAQSVFNKLKAALG